MFRQLPVVLLAAISAAVAADTRTGVEGAWLMQSGKAVIDVRPCGDALCGHIAEIRRYPADGARTDLHNRDPALRGRPLLGLPVLLDFRRGSAGWQGRVYDPKSGRAFAATLSLAAAETLSVKACILFVCRTQRWTRPH